MTMELTQQSPAHVVNKENRATRQSGLILLSILALALVVRIGFLPEIGYKGDTEHFGMWVSQINRYGLFNFYQAYLHPFAWDRTYPELAILIFGAFGTQFGAQFNPLASTFVIWLKVAPMICELGLIAVVYWWLRRDTLLRVLIPGLLAIMPGLVATTAWWGQYESPFTVFVVIALLALNRDRPALAWLSFAIAVMLKQPAVTITPLMFILTFRRYGWRAVLNGLVICAVVGGVLTLPFMIGSGFKQALTPYLNASDAFPFMSNNAYNFWYIFATWSKGSELIAFEPFLRDNQTLFNTAITFKMAGIAMLSLFTLLISVAMWRFYDRRAELIWGSALFFGYFMLPTQVHERYLYAGAILALIGIAQDRRLWWAAALSMFTYTYNVLAVAIPLKWPDMTLYPYVWAIPMAAITLIAMYDVTRSALNPDAAIPATAERPLPTSEDNAGPSVGGLSYT